MSEAEQALAKVEELLERLRLRVEEVQRLAAAESPAPSVDGLAEIAEIAKEAELELVRALAGADAQP